MMYPRYAVRPAGYRHRIQIGIRSQGTRFVSQIKNSDKQKRIVCALLAFILCEFHVTKSNAQAQSTNQLAAQQSFLTKLSQLQAVIDSSSDAVRDQLNKAQIAFTAATARQSQLAFAAWKDVGSDSLKLSASIGFACIAIREANTTEKVQAVFEVIRNATELSAALSKKSEQDAETRNQMTLVSSNLTAALNSGQRLTQLIADRDRITAEAQKIGLLPDISYDPKAGTFTATSPPRPATPGPTPTDTGYPFLGHWASTVAGNTCSGSTKTITRMNLTDSFEPESKCAFKDIKKLSATDFDLPALCDDPSGDGPPKFSTRFVIKMIDPNTIDIKPGKDPAIRYVRCSQPAAAPKLSSAPAPVQKPPTAPAAQKGQIGFLCKLTIGRQQQDWQISIDLNQGLYTARINNSVVRQRQAAILDLVLGNTIAPQFGQIRLQVNMGYNMFMTIHPDQQAFLQPLSGDNPKLVGTCADGTFQGL
jgi:hypothetical protein